MQEKMNDHFKQQQENDQAATNNETRKENIPAGEYIDFEEIK